MTHPLDVHQDSYHWRAYYQPDTPDEPPTDFLDEYDADGDHGWGEIDQEQLYAVHLLPQREGLQAHALFLTNGSRAFFCRRRWVMMNHAAQMHSEGTPTVHILGHEHEVDGQTVGSYLYLFDDGSSLLSDSLQAV